MQKINQVDRVTTMRTVEKARGLLSRGFHGLNAKAQAQAMECMTACTIVINMFKDKEEW